MAETKTEAVQVPLEKVTVNATRFHGAPDAEFVIDFSNSSNFYGQRVLLRGNIDDRWDIVDRMRGGQGAEVVASSVYDEGNPQKRPEAGSKLYAGGKFDRIAVANIGGFLSPADRVKEFKYLVSRTKLKEGGMLGVTAFDFENFESHAAKSENETVRRIGALSKAFAETTGLDRLAGRSLKDEAEAAIQGNNKLQAEVLVNKRPVGREDWPELKDLLAFQKGIIDRALKGLPPDVAFKTFLVGDILRGIKLPNGLSLFEFKTALKNHRQEIESLEPAVSAILELPAEERPETEPPLIYRSVISHKDKYPEHYFYASLDQTQRAVNTPRPLPAQEGETVGEV